MTRASALLTIVLGLSLAGSIPPAGAQGIRGEVRLIGSWLDYPVVVRDSLPESEVPGDGTTRRLPDGTVVACVPGGFCYWYRSGEKQSSHRMLQDLRLTGWPGWRGISSRLHVRGRLGSDEFWPASRQDVQVLNLYVDFDRSRWRLRGGRQEKTGGLGFDYFDGLDVLWRGSDAVRVEAFAGRSLIPTALESHTSGLLQDSEQLFPDKPATLIGVETRVRLGLDFSSSLLYQRELRTDRAGLYSERMALDARWTRSHTTADLSADFDVATKAFNEARLRLSRPVRSSLTLAAEGRYYRPYFDLWTIWGAFAPVGYAQAKVDLAWAARPDLSLNAAASYRDYEETHTGIASAPIEGDGWFSHAGADWSRGPVSLGGLVSVYRGFGAYRGALDLRAVRRWGSADHVGLFASGTQQIAEFRFGEGVTRGAGVEGRITRGSASLDGRLGMYRHTFDNRPGFRDYSQLRGQLGLTVRFGTEPGAREPGRDRMTMPAGAP